MKEHNNYALSVLRQNFRNYCKNSPYKLQQPNYRCT